jgi:hypothetical protein
MATAVLCAQALGAVPITAQEMAYPRVTHTRYEATNARAGGHFIFWLDRDKVW